MKPHARAMLTLLIALVLACPARADDAVGVPPPSDDAAVWYLTALLQIERSLKSFDDPDEALDIASATSLDSYDPEKAGPVIDRLQDSLDWARRGSTLSKCQWPATLEEDGPYALLPNLGEMRHLARMFTVSAMVKQSRGDLVGATDDCMVIMRLARHAGADHTVIGVLVQISIEGLAVQQIINQLPHYDRDGLTKLRDALDTLPPKVTMAQAVQTERVMALWMERLYKEKGYEEVRKQFGALVNEGFDVDENTPAFPTENDLLNMIEDLKKAYDELAQLMKLSPQQYTEATEKFEQKVENSPNVLIRVLLPSLSVARRSEFIADSKVAMLQAMIAYRLGGEDAFNKVLDPFDGKPFTRKVTEEGVVLTSTLIRHDKPLSQTFPSELAKPLQD